MAAVLFMIALLGLVVVSDEVVDFGLVSAAFDQRGTLRSPVLCFLQMVLARESGPIFA